MKMKPMLRKINKRGISLIVSYVLLISMALILATGVYIWLKSFNLNPPVDCQDGTTVIIDNYQCGNEFNLNIKNNGLFTVDGVVVTVSDDVNKQPYILLIPVDSPIIKKAGYYFFSNGLIPGNTTTAKFSSSSINGGKLNQINSVKIQPVMVDKKSQIICQKAVINQKIENCNLT